MLYTPSAFFDLSQTEHAKLFDDCKYVWDALQKLKEYIAANLKPGLKNKCDGRAYIADDVFIGEGTVVEDGAMIKGPTIIGRNCEIRHNAYIRENVIIGDNCVVGNACELKHSMLFNGCQVPHFSYVGDSIFGYKSHLGAGVKISNVKLMPGNVCLAIDDKIYDTGLRKFGAILGDYAEVGCNSVLNPGSVIGKRSVIYPNTSWRGILPEDMIVKLKQEQVVVLRRARAS
ncbi:MAG: glmU [Verrucomicrobiales bacterium]|jgi:NDP-sugar pyrophosphorylase family protein|nr:glmU [Verrucomicrobiales bacterium]